MSTNVSSTILIDTSCTDVDVVPREDLVATSSQDIDLQTVESIVEGHKKEYSIVGDGLYASVSADEAPTWLTSLIDSVVATSVASGMTNYDLLVQDVLNAIDSIDVASNAYVEQIDISSIVNGIVTSRLTTLNATYGSTYATKTELSSAVATSASAIATDISDLNVSFNSTIDSRITSIQTAFAAADSALASDVNALTTAFADQSVDVSGNASAVEGLQTYVGLAYADGAPDGTGLLGRIAIVEKQTDGVIATVTGTYDVMLGSGGSGGTLDIVNSALPYATWIAAESATSGEEEWVRASHVGDVYIKYSVDANSNKVYLAAYKFIKTAVDATSPFSTDAAGYTWAVVTDTDTQNAYMVALQAYDLADNKRRVFTTTPFGPYSVGDLWTAGPTGHLQRCKTENLVASTYTASHWELASKYTDDSTVITLSDGLADGTVVVDLSLATIDGAVNLSTYVSGEVNGLVVVFSGTNHLEFDANNPSTVKVNDIYIEATTDTSGAVDIDVTNTWKCTDGTVGSVTWNQINSNTNLTALADLTDGKRTIYGGSSLPVASTANPFMDNDLFIPTSTFTDVTEYVENEIYRYSSTTWVKATRYDSIINNLSNQLDNKVELHFGGSTPPFADKISSASDARGGDYWYCDTNGTYDQGNIYSYAETTNATNATLFDYTWTLSSDISRDAFDLADGKRTVYSNAATNVPNTVDESIQLNDLWIPSSTAGAYTSGKVYKCTNITTPVWEEVDYTNDAVVDGIQDGSIPLDPAVISIGTVATTLTDYIVAEADKRVHVYSGTIAPTDGNPTGVENNDIYIWNTTEVKSVEGANVTYDVIYTYKYNITAGANLKWESITSNSNITNLSDLADGKRTIYANESDDEPAGEVNDLWIPTTAGTSAAGIAADALYIPSEIYQYTSNWVLATKYTDDTTVIALNNGLANGTKVINLASATVDGTTLLTTHIADELDGVVTVYSGGDVTGQTDMDVNDLYVETTLVTAANATTYDVVKVYKFTVGSPDDEWIEQTGASGSLAALQDLTDGKRTIFNTATPAGMLERDMWIPNVTPTDNTKIIGEIYVYNGTAWTLATRYTEDLEGFVDVINPKVATLQNQIDGKIVYHFYDSAVSPATESSILAGLKAVYTTDALKEAANGNITYFKDTTNGYWYGSATDSWLTITDTSVMQALKKAEDAQGTADGKVSQFYAWGHPSTAPYAIVENSVTVAAAASFKYWFKADGKLYYKPSTTWVLNPNVAEGDIVNVFDPLLSDSTMHTYNGTSWQQAGPTGIISKSSFFVDLENDVTGATGHVASALSSLKSTTDTYADDEGARVENKFEYGSTTILNGQHYSSGFGLHTLGTTGNGTAGNAYNSEFWIDAQKFKFTNTGNTGQASPFSIDASGTTPQVTFNGVVSFSNVTGSTKPADNANFLDLSAGAMNNASLVFNPGGELVGGDGRPAGIKATYTSATKSNISYQDTANTIVKLHSTDSSVGMCYPAFKVTAGATYTIFIRVKASATSGSGFYFRMQEYDADLPVGVQNVGHSTSESGVVASTRQITSFRENQGIGTSWETYTYTYTPTTTTKWTSPLFLNWSGMGNTELHVDTCMVVSDATTGMTGTEYGRIFANGKTTIDGGNIEADTLAVGAINMTQISDLNTDLGTIVAGKLENADGSFVIDLNNKLITITV